MRQRRSAIHEFSTLALIAGTLFGAGVLQAQSPSLAWTNQSVSLTTTNAETEVIAEFPFENRGKSPVKIGSMKTGCDCAVATLDHDTYAPGEKGVLKVAFRIGFRTGKQDRSILVETDDAPRAPTELRLSLDIAELLPLQPKLLFWSRGETSIEKCITLTPREPDKTKLLSAVSSEPGFSLRIETAPDKGQIRLWVKPTGTGDYTQTQLRLRYSHDGKELEANAFAAVR